MKIYVLPVDPRLQPESQPFRYPAHNADYGVEQDFLRWLDANPHHHAESAASADWHLLPVFWTRWHYNHDFAQVGREELAELASAAILDDARTFTVCQPDEGPTIDLGETVLFLSSRRTAEGIDIPLLSDGHRRPLLRGGKRYTASFSGRLSTHPVREQLARELAGRADVKIRDQKLHLGVRGFIPTRRFVRLTLGSYIALCPRGFGGSSFRFYEAMGLGVVPYMIGDVDTRPFKRFIDWSELSLFSGPGTVAEELDGADHQRLLAMGAAARETWERSLTYQRWCPLLVRELELARS